MSSDKADLYTRITNRIVTALEEGIRPWLQPWNSAHAAGPITRPLRHGGERYRGINVLMLWGEAMEKGFSCPIWMTFKQAQTLGGNVRKGQHGTLVVYANRIRRTETGDNGEDVEREIPFLKGYTVFNCEQIDGLPAHYLAPAVPQQNPDQRIAAVEAFYGNTGAEIRHGGGSAYYNIADDFVQLPNFESFHDGESYYATLGHEITHWTRHPTRLNRDFGRKRWGDQGYATEELVAEIGSAFLSADLGLTLEPRADHASYIANWLQVLKNDKRAIFTAAAHAEGAVGYLHSLQPQLAMAEEAG